MNSANNTEDPLLSVVVVTYNHKPFIAECLDSILAQQCSFPYEVLIGEDESTDGTREICQSYAEKYPDQVRLFLRSRSDVIEVDGKPSGRFNFIETVKEARGKYVAVCDGDDYWSDTGKLQKQVDFLEGNPDFAASYHPISLHRQSSGETEHAPISAPQPDKSKVTLEDLAQYGCIPNTSSAVFRNIFQDGFPEWFKQSPTGDYPLFMLLAQHGPLGFQEGHMAVYRLHGDGFWSPKGRVDMYLKMARGIKVLLQHDFKPEIKQQLIDQNRKNLRDLILDELDAGRLDTVRRIVEEIRKLDFDNGFDAYLADKVYLNKLEIILQSGSYGMAQKLSKAIGSIKPGKGK